MKDRLSPINPPDLDKASPDTIDNAVNNLFEQINIATEENIRKYKKRYISIKQYFNSPLIVKLIQNYQNYFTNQDNPLHKDL